MARFIFSTSNSTNNSLGGVWATDGTAAGTVNIGTYQGAPYASDIVRLGPEFNGKSYYIEQDYAGNGAELNNLVGTDGTVAGTKSVLTLQDSETPVPVGIWEINNKLVAAGTVAGTLGGTGPVTPGLLVSTDGTNFAPITSGITASDIVMSNGLGFFTGISSSGGNTGLWRTDGTTSGTYNVDPPGVALDPVNITGIGNGLTIFANRTNNTLWVTNGTSAGTSEIVNAGSGTLTVSSILPGVGTATVNGQAVFGAVDSSGDYSIWTTNGTAEGSREIFNGGIVNGPTRPILGVGAWGSSVIVESGYGLYVINTAGAVTNINPWPQYGNSPPSAFITLGSKIIMSSPLININGVNEPSTLFVSDGTAAGTAAVNVPGLQSINGDFTLVGNQVVFEGTDTSGKQAFFATDGTTANSHELSLPAGVALDAAHLPFIEAVPNSGPPLTGIVTLGGGNQFYNAVAGTVVQAGSGDDTIMAASGNVTVTGSSGHLSFFGGPAASSVTGGSGSATILGGSGGGVYVGGSAGRNVMVSQGAAGAATTITGMGGGNQIFGSAAGNDILSAGSGRDTIVGGGGSTVINGAPTGSVVFTGGTTTVNGGTGGHDTIVGGTGALGVTMQNGDAVFGGGGALNVAGSLKGADSIVGGSGTLNVAGRGANMLVVGGTSQSNVNVGNGASLIFAGSGNMSLIGGAGSMQVLAGSGTATVIEGTGPTTLQVVRGQAGGTDVISGFRPGTDNVNLFGYQASEQTVSPSAGSTIIALNDGTKITLLGVANPGHSIFG